MNPAGDEYVFRFGLSAFTLGSRIAHHLTTPTRIATYYHKVLAERATLNIKKGCCISNIDSILSCGPLLSSSIAWSRHQGEERKHLQRTSLLRTLSKHGIPCIPYSDHHVPWTCPLHMNQARCDVSTSIGTSSHMSWLGIN